MEQGISAHGTIIEFWPIHATSGVSANAWHELPEVGDITMPGLMRNEFDITSQNRDIDTFILGVLRRNDFQAPLFYNARIPEHQAIRYAMIMNDTIGWRATSPDGTVLIFSGGIKGLPQNNPVDGPQECEFTVRPTGSFILDGVEYGL